MLLRHGCVDLRACTSPVPSTRILCSEAALAPTETSSPQHPRKGAPVFHLRGRASAADFKSYFMLESHLGWLQSSPLYVCKAQ